jgi:hypothetical protein
VAQHAWPLLQFYPFPPIEASTPRPGLVIKQNVTRIEEGTRHFEIVLLAAVKHGREPWASVAGMKDREDEKSADRKASTRLQGCKGHDLE